MSATHALGLDVIRIDGGTQPRADISQETVREYAEYMQAGTVLPPVDVFFDGAAYWLADGFHRYWAARKIDRAAVTATVHLGTVRDAVLFSVSANVGHGLQRTNADKRKSTLTLLRDEEWAKWSDREIAGQCCVSKDLVGDVRRSLSVGDREKSPVIFTTKHGTDATMKVGKIGRRPSGPGARAAREAAYAAKNAMAIEGAAPGVLKRRQSRSTDKQVTTAMQLLTEIVVVLERVDVAVLANDPRASDWHDTTTAAMSALRAFLRKLERKSA